MAARALWKGVVRLGDTSVPVKLYAAVKEMSIHFRLVHRKDMTPVRQVLVRRSNGSVVPYEEARRAFVTARGDLVVLDEADLESLEPEPSRDIEVLQFLPTHAIDHRWYKRPYWLGPDGGAGASHAALTKALEKSNREGLARWVMRGKEHIGVLRVHSGYPMLISLRHANEVVAVEELEAPKGPALSGKDMAMAKQLMEMMVGDFEPDAHRDEYRVRVEELIAKKASGKVIQFAPAAARDEHDDISRALEASLKEAHANA